MHKYPFAQRIFFSILYDSVNYLVKESGVAIGKRVARLRAERKLTQQELAARAGVSQAIISRLETEDRENVTSDVLKGLATALGCTTDYLVGMHEDEQAA
jgi:transcriptional regulator with XRE-family HTH domain